MRGGRGRLKPAAAVCLWKRTLWLGLALKCGTPEGAGDVRDGKTNNSALSSLCNSLPPS